jgi:hypothetical protein
MFDVHPLHESPQARALENKGLECGSEKKCPMYLNGYPVNQKPEDTDADLTQ